jgi:hypothetical protein
MVENRHRHNGIDSERVDIRDLFKHKKDSLTTADTNTADGTYGATEQNIINNLQTRLNELEAILQKFGIIK